MATLSLAEVLTLTPSQWARLQPVEAVNYPPITSQGLKLLIKREDQLHSQLSGNKLYKLHGHIHSAISQSKKNLISFGGYYSNHLHALSYAAAALNWPSYGLIRGHQPRQLSPTLNDCQRQGMQLVFLSRREYDKLKNLANQPAELLNELQLRFDLPAKAYVVPEGGGGSAGLSGCSALMNSLRQQTILNNATICIACGTGTTLAGLLSASCSGEQFLGVSALKLGDQLVAYKESIRQQLGIEVAANWDIMDDSRFGGFARTSPELFSFIEDFEGYTGIPLEPVYTAKLMFQLVNLAGQGYWPEGHSLLVVHTGGLQGRRGYATLTEHQG